MKSNHMSKLFGVLVLGGAVMAQAGDNLDLVETDGDEIKTHCQVEVVTKSYDKFGQVSTEAVNCVDDKDKEEIILLIEEAKEASCVSPFCGCWLG